MIQQPLQTLTLTMGDAAKLAGLPRNRMYQLMYDGCARCINLHPVMCGMGMGGESADANAMVPVFG
ncbi:hypothetical protein [Rhodanobacter lindaniclasticus]